MAIKTILVPLPGMKEGSTPLEVAIQLARRYEATITALHVDLDPTEALTYVGEGMTAAMIDDVVHEVEHENEARNKVVLGEFAQAVKNAGMKTDRAKLVTVMGREQEETVRYGRMADLLVMSRPSESTSPDGEVAFETALLESGRPMLTLPPNQDPAAVIGKKIVVAWNGSSEAMRALTAAIPFMHHAESVEVISVGEVSSSLPSLELVARYLASHGVTAEIREIPKNDAVADVVLREAERVEADLLVMGAYTHSRLRELFFGGATVEVLSNAQIPVLMVH